MVFSFFETKRGTIEEGGTGRPPADELINEFFFDKKCGRNESRQAFFEWCFKKNLNKVNAFCQGVTGTTGQCYFEAEFLPRSRSFYRAAGNITSTTMSSSSSVTSRPNGTVTTSMPSNITTTTTIKPNQELPGGLKYTHSCNYGGPSKWMNWSQTIKINSTTVQKISKFCEQELYGVQGWPLWLILLVVFLVILAVSIAAAIFWHHWLKRKIYGRGPGNGVSSMGSQYTSAPYSSTSGFNSRMPSSSRIPSGSRMPSSSHTSFQSRASSDSRIPSASRLPSSGRPMSQRSSARSSSRPASSSLRSLQHSQRSGMSSRSSSRKR